jgi:hypothetical protein
VAKVTKNVLQSAKPGTSNGHAFKKIITFFIVSMQIDKKLHRTILKSGNTCIVSRPVADDFEYMPFISIKRESVTS